MIEKALTLSTGHVKYETTEFLNMLSDTVSSSIKEQMPRISSHEYGWIIFMNLTEDGMPTEEWLEEKGVHELHAIFQHALANDCNLINLDQDVESTNQFPTFEW